jgi:hypothetical protein
VAPFEVVLSVYGLLLGFTLNEMLGGFARTFKTRRGGEDIRIGWLTPLTALFVIVEITGFWSIGYAFRDRLFGDHLTLLAVLAIIGTYYLSASLIFPLKPEEWPDYDLWYERQKKLIFGGMLAANMLGFAGQILLDQVRPMTEDVLAEQPVPSDAAILVELFTMVGVLGLVLALIFVKGRRTNLVLLSLLVAIDLLAAFGRSAL